jgi:hypothetical protein
VGIAQAVASGAKRTSSTRLAATAVALLALAAPALAGCAANFDAPTNQPYQPAAGISNRDGDVYALDTLVVTDGEGNGTVISQLVNKQDGADTLDSYAATDSAGDQITAEPLAQPITLGTWPSPDQAVQVGTSGSLRLTGDNLVAGHFVTLTFTFDAAAPVTVDVPVVVGGSDTIYSDIPVGPAPSEPTDSTAATG